MIFWLNGYLIRDAGAVLREEYGRKKEREREGLKVERNKKNRKEKKRRRKVY